jgi:hypothetical protein
MEILKKYSANEAMRPKRGISVTIQVMKYSRIQQEEYDVNALNENYCNDDAGKITGWTPTE